MKRIITVLAVLASLALAPTALAHPNVTGSASQACDEATGLITLNASFSNAGFDESTTVTATDSGGAPLGSSGSPATFSATVPGPDRAAGTVTFDWTAGNDSGTIVAPYDAVSGCVAPPPPPPPPPPPHHPPHSSGPPPSVGHSPPNTLRRGTPNRSAKAPAGVQNGTLPFSGLPLGWMAFVACGLIGAGGLLRRKA